MNASDVSSYPLQLVIAPLERLALPAHLDGSMLPRGSFLSNFPLDARNDLEALHIWLAEAAKSEASFRSYRLEAERCLLWATVVRGKPLTALNEEDIRDYARFLLDPHPRDRWTSDSKIRRDDDGWRPFRGPLSPRSRDRALGVIASLFKWLEASGYLYKSPWNGPLLTSRNFDKDSMAPATALEQRASVATFIEWLYVRKVLDELETHEDLPTSLRTRAILFLAYFADLKPGEISSLQTSSIRVLSLEPGPVWQLDIENRPAHVRTVLLLPPAQKALQKYLDSRGIAVNANAFGASFPVIVSSRDSQYWSGSAENLSEHTVQRSTREVFLLAAKLAQSNGDTAAARRLSGTTLHWLRHAFEVHTVQLHSGKQWCWHLLGACWLAPPSSRRYLPKRTVISPEIALAAFEELRSIWQTQPIDDL